MKLGIKFLAVFWTLPDYKGFLSGVSSCATFGLSTLHHLPMVEIQEFQAH